MVVTSTIDSCAKSGASLTFTFMSHLLSRTLVPFFSSFKCSFVLCVTFDMNKGFGFLRYNFILNFGGIKSCLFGNKANQGK